MKERLDKKEMIGKMFRAQECEVNISTNVGPFRWHEETWRTTADGKFVCTAKGIRIEGRHSRIVDGDTMTPDYRAAYQMVLENVVKLEEENERLEAENERLQNALKHIASRWQGHDGSATWEIPWAMHSDAVQALEEGFAFNGQGYVPWRAIHPQAE